MKKNEIKLIKDLYKHYDQNQDVNEDFIKAMAELIIKKENYNFDGKLFPPKIQCPNNFKKCPCLSYE